MENLKPDNENVNLLFEECLDYLKSVTENVNNDLTGALNCNAVINVGQRSFCSHPNLHNEEPNQPLYEKAEEHFVAECNKELVERKSSDEIYFTDSMKNNNFEKVRDDASDILLDKFQIKEDLKFENDRIEIRIDEDACQATVVEAGGTNTNPDELKATCKIVNEVRLKCHSEDDLLNPRDVYDTFGESRSERIRKLSQQLPKIIITPSDGCTPVQQRIYENKTPQKWVKVPYVRPNMRRTQPRRRVTKDGVENVALIKNIPFEKMRLLNDTFHTLINLRWRWIVLGTVLVHFAIWFVFAVFWYIAALAHYDFDPNPPQHRCITGGTDFLNIFLASVEAQTTIGFGDRTIDEECPESIFLFIMQLIMGTGLSGVLTCVVYAKLTRPENFTKEGVGFSRRAVVSLRDGRLCLMFRAWDLNHDHIIGSQLNVYLIRTSRTKEGEVLKHYTQSLHLRQRQLMLWPVTVTHVIDENSPLYEMSPEDLMNICYEIAVSLKGASASMGTFTQSQTSYLPRELMWGYRFPSVVRYSHHEQMYVIDHKNLDTVEEVETPLCSARRLSMAHLPAPPSTPGHATPGHATPGHAAPGQYAPGQYTPGQATPEQYTAGRHTPGNITPSCFTEQIDTFQRLRTSSFKRKNDSNA